MVCEKGLGAGHGERALIQGYRRSTAPAKESSDRISDRISDNRSSGNDGGAATKTTATT